MKCTPLFVAALSLALAAEAGETREGTKRYLWQDGYRADRAVESRFAPPGYQRVAEEAGSFGWWLRGVPLKEGNPPVLLFSGERKANQNAHAAVMDIDVGNRNLQQCADAVIRLRAEYLLARGRTREIRFRFTSGDLAEFSKWAEGYRPTVRGNKVTWARTQRNDASYASFRRYLDVVFTYAGSLSLSRELEAVPADEAVRVGDVFIQGGSPGHAVIVLDVAQREPGGQQVFLLAQSYMPAQEIHILKNPRDSALSPWYPSSFGDELVTPEWTFRKTDRKRFVGR